MSEKAQSNLRRTRNLGRKARAAFAGVAAHALVIILSLWTVVPFLWILTCSLRSAEEVYARTPRWIPPTFTLEAYSWLLGQKEFYLPLVNSLLTGFATALISTVVASLAAYSLVRYRYPGRRVIGAILLASQMLPFVLLLLPLFILYNKIGLYNTRLGLIIGFTTFSVPFSILLLRSYFDTLPPDLEEQAMVDGCTKLGALWRVTFPLAAPGIVAAALNTFVLVWNDVLFTLILSRDTRVQTLSVSLYNMSHTYRRSRNLNGILAMGVIITIPVSILFVILQKHLVQGMTAGAMKA